MSILKALWTHNFDPSIENAGNFMHQFASGMSDYGIHLKMFYTGSLNDLFNVYRARCEIKKISRKFDLVHSQFGSACSAVSAAAESKKIISLRGSDFYSYKAGSTWNIIHSQVATKITRVSIPQYDAIITMSNRMAKDVKAVFPKSNVQAIPDPIDLIKFRPIDKHFARKKLFGSDNMDPWILFTTLSSNNPIKRIYLAEKAVKIAAKVYKNIELKIASGIPHHLMPLFVSSCDVALTTSIHEGWPNAIKEALACNVPFVATDVSDLREIAQKEENCRISEPDPLNIAMNLCQVIKKPPNGNLRRHVKFFGMEDTCNRLFHFYKNTLENN